MTYTDTPHGSEERLTRKELTHAEYVFLKNYDIFELNQVQINYKLKLESLSKKEIRYSLNYMSVAY
jgi:hypothetical protein